MSKKPEDVDQGAWDAAVAMWQRGRGMDDVARAIMAAVEAERERCAAIIEATMLCTGGDNSEVLLPRASSGNKVGLAYAAAIRNSSPS